MIAAGPPSRARCLRCWRPASLCLCRRLTATPTRTRVVFLQHPRERAVRMGTARLAHLALADSELHVGVRFDDHPRVAALAAAPRGDVALLYPGPDATPIDRLATPPATLVVVDGTWITARKVVARSRLLRSLPRVSLAPAAPSAYRIRREPAPHCLSTVEAVIAALTALEGDPARFAALHAAFGELVATQVGYATARPAPYRHERKRRRPRRPSAAAELLATRFADLVLAQAEGNPHADGGPHELVQLLAVRPATGERFARVVRPRRPVGDHTPARLGLAPDRLDAGAPVEVARADWAAFLRPDDVLCSWGGFTAAVLRHEGFVCPPGVDVRGETARRLGRNPGGVEAACAALAAVADPPWAPGRGGRRVAALAALLARLRTESGVRFHPSERAVGGSHRWE